MSKNIIAESHRIQKMYIFKKYFGVFFFIANFALSKF